MVRSISDLQVDELPLALDRLPPDADIEADHDWDRDEEGDHDGHDGHHRVSGDELKVGKVRRSLSVDFTHNLKSTQIMH